MAIAGLTTQRATLPPVIGKLRKGGEKPAQGNKPGADLDHFRFTSRNDNPAMEADFAAAYGSTPQRIEAYLPADEVDTVFDAWCEEWSASELKHRCDGQYIYARNRYTGEYERTNEPCPYANSERKNCKQIGRLALLLPELVAAGHYGIVTMETHSVNDIANLYRALTDFRQRFGRLTGVPFYVYRYAEKISTPSGKDGGRARREKWLVGITPATEFVQRQLETARRHALTDGAHHALPAPVDEETGEILDGEAVRVDNSDLANAAERLWGMAEWETKLAATVLKFSKGATDDYRELNAQSAGTLTAMLSAKADALQPCEQCETPIDAAQAARTMEAIGVAVCKGCEVQITREVAAA